MNTISLLGISKESIAVILDLLQESGFHQFNLYPNLENSILPNLPQKLISYNLKSLDDVPIGPVFFGIASPNNKLAVYNYFAERYHIKKQSYIDVIHPSAYVANSAIIENGVLIEPNATVSSQSYIGFGVFVKRGAQIGHHNTIGNFTDINPGVIISGKVTIGKNCLIGSGTVIKDNITIGDNTVIGVGSVVTKNIQSNVIAFGNPCRVIKDNTI